MPKMFEEIREPAGDDYFKARCYNVLYGTK